MWYSSLAFWMLIFVYIYIYKIIHVFPGKLFNVFRVVGKVHNCPQCRHLHLHMIGLYSYIHIVFKTICWTPHVLFFPLPPTLPTLLGHTTCHGGNRGNQSFGRSSMKRPTLRMPCIGFTSYRMGKGRLADWDELPIFASVQLSWFLSRCFPRNWNEALTTSYGHWWTSRWFVDS